MSIDTSTGLQDPNSQAMLQYLKRLVAEAGGKYIGIQKNLLSEEGSLYFRNSQTDHALYVSINFAQFLSSAVIEAIHDRIERDNEIAKCRRVALPVARLREIVDQLKVVLEEIEALYKEKK